VTHAGGAGVVRAGIVVVALAVLHTVRAVGIQIIEQPVAIVVGAVCASRISGRPLRSRPGFQNVIATVLALAALVPRALVSVVAVARITNTGTVQAGVVDSAVQAVVAIAPVGLRRRAALSALLVAGPQNAYSVECAAVLGTTLACAGHTCVIDGAGIGVGARLAVREWKVVAFSCGAQVGSAAVVVIAFCICYALFDLLRPMACWREQNAEEQDAPTI
jgi:hypothetical protein